MVGVVQAHHHPMEVPRLVEGRKKESNILIRLFNGRTKVGGGGHIPRCIASVTIKGLTHCRVARRRHRFRVYGDDGCTGGTPF